MTGSDRYNSIYDSKNCNELSGGEKQIVLLARALLSDKEILVLDEPLANLDGESAKLLMDTLCQLADAGYAVLVAEHRLDMVLPFVDNVWNICLGQVVKVENKQQYLQSQIVKIFDESEKFTNVKELFKINNLAFKIKKQDILKNIDFPIYKGERLLLLGENGSGKTTFIKIIGKIEYANKREY